MCISVVVVVVCCVVLRRRRSSIVGGKKIREEDIFNLLVRDGGDSFCTMLYITTDVTINYTLNLIINLGQC